MRDPEGAAPGIAAALPPPLRRALDDFLSSLEGDGSLSGSTRSAYRRDVERYLDFAAGRRAREPGALDRALVRHHVEELRRCGRSPATVARALSSLRRFHDCLRLCDPTAGLDPPRVERRDPEPLSVADAERLVGAVRGEEPLALRDRAILEVLYAAGLRVSELTALRGEDLLLDNALVRVRGRGARERMVPLGRAAVHAAHRYARYGRPALVAAASDPAFFLSARGRALSRMSVWKTIRAAAGAAGLARAVNPQTLRHTFAAHLLDGGADLRDVQQLLGHAVLSTTLVYARVDDERLRQLHREYHPRG